MFKCFLGRDIRLQDASAAAQLGLSRLQDVSAAPQESAVTSSSAVQRSANSSIALGQGDNVSSSSAQQSAPDPIPGIDIETVVSGLLTKANTSSRDAYLLVLSVAVCELCQAAAPAKRFNSLNEFRLAVFEKLIAMNNTSTRQDQYGNSVYLSPTYDKKGKRVLRPWARMILCFMYFHVCDSEVQMLLANSFCANPVETTTVLERFASALESLYRSVSNSVDVSAASIIDRSGTKLTSMVPTTLLYILIYTHSHFTLATLLKLSLHPHHPSR